MTDRQSIMSWPSLLVLALASWGILSTAPRLVSHRPRSADEALRIGAGYESITSRLWQDPLATAYRAESDPKSRYEPPSFQDVLTGQLAGRQEVDSMRVLVVTVLLPGNQYAEEAEQCRRRRFAAVSALDRAGFIPHRSETIGFMRYANLIVPFEWFEREDRPVLVFLHWVDESQISEAPLARLAVIHKDFHEVGRQVGVQLHHAILGPVSSTTLLRMWQQRDIWKDLPDTAIYSTQATATTTRNVTADQWPRNLHLHHFIGTDEQLADQIKDELALRGVDEGDRVALIGEWDTHYGRNMLATLREVFAGDKAKNIVQIKYLRGLDGVLPGEMEAGSTDRESKSGGNLLFGGSASTEMAHGRGQTDYVRRVIHRLKQSEPSVRAICLAGSDVYDKLLLMRALRHEFRTATLFTTDLDARLVNRGEYASTHNLLIASHYDLSLAEFLQGTVPPFRDSYQTSLFLGTLTLLKNQQLLGGVNAQLEEEITNATGSPPVLIFEVGRTGPFRLNVEEGDATHPPSDHSSGLPRPRQQLLTIAALLLIVIFLLPFSGPVQQFGVAVWRREFGWGHLITLVAMVSFLYVVSQIWVDQGTTTREPFALFEGISIWPTLLLRLFLIVFCVFSVWQSHELLQHSFARVSADVLGQDPQPTRAAGRSWWATRKGWRTCGKDLLRRWAAAITGFSLVACWRRLGECWRWLIGNTMSGWHEAPAAQGSAAQPDSLTHWQAYQRRGQLSRRHVRLLAHLIVFLLFVGLLFGFLGLATSPARGPLSRSLNRVVFSVCGVTVGWLMFYVLDAIRLCSRMIEILAQRKTKWPERVITKALADHAAADNDEFRRIIDYLLGVRLVARHTDVVARLVYPPCVALLVWFVARHAVFDNWSWVPQISIPFVLSLLITFYCATVLGRSAVRFKRHAEDAVDAIVKSLPWKSDERAHAEALLKELQAIGGGAMVPLRRNPVIAAATVPFGSLSSIYLLDFLMEYFG